MDAAVGVLCTRIRLEEKRLIEALAQAGVPAEPLTPCPSPLPLQPPATGFVSGGVRGCVIDRCLDRVIAQAVLRHPTQDVIGAGVAASSDRLTVMALLSQAGIPRPATLLAISEATGLRALESIGFPATILPLDCGEPEIALCDLEIAEAVLEHRTVLGRSQDAVALIQAGGCGLFAKITIFVVAGRAVAYAGSDSAPSHEQVRFAELAATALGADVIAIDLSDSPSGVVVWDVHPVPEFRYAITLSGTSIENEIVQLVRRRLGTTPATGLQGADGDSRSRRPALRREVTDDVALTA